MLSVQRLKRELKVNSDLTGLLDALKWISLAQFRLLQKKRERFADFTEAFEGFFRIIDFGKVEHPFARGEGRLGIIMITSDEGFMGGLNSRVITTALSYPGAADAHLVMLGERGANYLRENGRQFVHFPGVTTEERYEAALKLKDYIIKEGLAGKFGRLVLFYAKPVSFTVQEVEAVKILPCGELFEKRKDMVSGTGDLIMESPINGIIEYLVGTWITERLFEILEDSKLSEFSARAVHLEESHQVLEKRDREIKLQYFRSQHNLIDKGIRETFSSQILRKEAV